jgi:site-specific DNA-methyltransferase (adenine-specific)
MVTPERTGRWPANLIHDGGDDVLGLFPHTKSGKLKSDQYITPSGNNESMFAGDGAYENKGYEADQGSAARFFYCAKASRKDRNEGIEHLPAKEWSHEGAPVPQRAERPFIPSQNNHPTVKPTDLMRYLCRLVTPPNGIVLDPFTGSGSTGKAAVLEGFQFIGIEREAEYVDIARARIESAYTPPQEPDPQQGLFA